MHFLQRRLGSLYTANMKLLTYFSSRNRLFCLRGLLIIVIVALAACGEKDTVPKPSYQLTVSFADGTEKGTHHYRLSDAQASRWNIQYSPSINISVISIHEVIAADDVRRIFELRRFARGELKVGELPATGWTTSLPQIGKMDCGSLRLKDVENQREFTNVFGKYEKCTPLKITKIGQWQERENNRVRAISGEFSDTLALKTVWDDRPVEESMVDIHVSFTLPEYRPKSANKP